ncbi:amino acid ABC transporter permease [Streptomyces sp. NBC_00669]|uniref:amino acid ABC transporter permease n=1 Tax=unclassified Streptomyces TaxID=2593676 RepID=UPI002E30CC57|nr:amino acid ABC transporter permease [Streptomyces sp. NBC_00669]
MADTSKSPQGTALPGNTVPPPADRAAGGAAVLPPHPFAGMTRSPHPHYARKVAAVVVVLVCAFWLQGLARNKNLAWGTVGDYFFDHSILEGLERTVIITVASIAIAVVLGAVLANMRLSANSVLRGAAGVYVWFFRSMPLLVLLILVYNFSLIYPALGLGVPFGPQFFDVDTKNLVQPVTAAIVAFGLQQAAYTSEVLRAAILAVPNGQREAATALGMSNIRTLRRIVFPQALRTAVPPIANESINLLKSTSLVAFISVPDLLYSVQQIYNSNFQVIPLLIVASLWYMIIVSVMSVGQTLLERTLRNTRGRSANRPKAIEVDQP